MAQGYYSLEEAAQLLGISPDELKKMARRNEIRPFFDRGQMRFRSQEVDDKARSLGRPAGGDQPAGAAQGGAGSPGGEVFGFNLSPEDSDQVEIGQEILHGSSSKLGRQSGSQLRGPESPPPKKTDSGTKPRDSGMIPLVSDSDVKVVEDAGPRSGPKGGTADPKSGTRRGGPKSDPPKRKSGLASGDSGVRLVPMEGAGSDSDVKIVPDHPDEEAATIHLAGASPEDSDIRLNPESGVGKKKAQPTMMSPNKEAMQTEEIDLDAELQKAPAAEAKSKSKLKPPAPATKPSDSSPFELSDADVAVPADKARPPATKKESVLSLSDDEEVELGGEVAKGGVSAHDSGINLQRVSDSGISLEKPDEDAESVEFELQPDESNGPSTNKGKGKGKKPAAAAPAPSPADSIEEVTAEESGSGEILEDDSSSSEFELTLDDSGLAPIEDENATVQKQAGEKDIFETDFEMPALEDESGFEPVPIEEGDTDLESSDFDLALGEEDIAAEDESGSQVVALEDEEEADEAAATVARPPKKKKGGGDAEVAEEEGIEDLLADEDIVADEEVEEEAEAAPATVMVSAPPTEWGPLPMIVLIPSVLLLFFVGIMAFEVMHTMWGYHQPAKPVSPVVSTVTGWFIDVSKESKE